MHTAALPLIATLALAPLLAEATQARPVESLRLYNWADYIGEDTLAGFEKATGSAPAQP